METMRGFHPQVSKLFQTHHAWEGVENKLPPLNLPSRILRFMFVPSLSWQTVGGLKTQKTHAIKRTLCFCIMPL